MLKKILQYIYLVIQSLVLVFLLTVGMFFYILLIAFLFSSSLNGVSSISFWIEFLFTTSLYILLLFLAVFSINTIMNMLQNRPVTKFAIISLIGFSILEIFLCVLLILNQWWKFSLGIKITLICIIGDIFNCCTLLLADCILLFSCYG